MRTSVPFEAPERIQVGRQSPGLTKGTVCASDVLEQKQKQDPRFFSVGADDRSTSAARAPKSATAGPVAPGPGAERAGASGAQRRLRGYHLEAGSADGGHTLASALVHDIQRYGAQRGKVKSFVGHVSDILAPPRAAGRPATGAPAAVGIARAAVAAAAHR